MQNLHLRPAEACVSKKERRTKKQLDALNECWRVTAWISAI